MLLLDCPGGSQIMSSRLKILLMPPGRGLVPPYDQNVPEEAANMSPVIMKGMWEDRKADHEFHGRLRSEHIHFAVCFHIIHTDYAACPSHTLCFRDQLQHLSAHSTYTAQLLLLSISAVHIGVHSILAKLLVVLLM